jgi:hypothetical protein
MEFLTTEQTAARLGIGLRRIQTLAETLTITREPILSRADDQESDLRWWRIASRPVQSRPNAAVVGQPEAMYFFRRAK